MSNLPGLPSAVLKSDREVLSSVPASWDPGRSWKGMVGKDREGAGKGGKAGEKGRKEKGEMRNENGEGENGRSGWGEHALLEA